MTRAATERRYDDKEVALILDRAAEAVASNSGLTLAELKEIGAEAGIPDAHIEEAARTVALGRRRSSARSVIGMPPRVDIERLVPVRLRSEDWPYLLDVIRSELDRRGSDNKSYGDGDLNWRDLGIVGDLSVSLREEGDATSVRVRGKYGPVLYFFAGFLGVYMAIGSGALADHSGAPDFFILLSVLLGWASSLLPWSLFFRRKRKSLERLLNAIDRRLRELS